MDWQERMRAGISWIESRLAGEFDIEEAARAANTSPFHFMRMFDVIAGVSPAEYARRRRLSRAAMDLATSDERIIDIALKYGYESPDSFTRAFKREFDCLPSDARKPGTALHSYQPLSFSVALSGATAMEFRIERRPALPLTGIPTRISTENGENFRQVPLCWKAAEADGTLKALCSRLRPGGLGLLGVCHEFDMARGDFTYSIAMERPDDGAPGTGPGEAGPGSRDDGELRCVDFEIPAATWARITSRGPLVPNFQNTIKRVFSEWFPASGKEHAGTAEIEYYGCDGDPGSAEYWCEYWVPLR